MSVDIEALQKFAKSKKQNKFINLLPLLRREKPTLKLAEIIEENMSIKKDTRPFFTLPILTQAFGAGKTHFMKNLPKLFEEYCPENKQLKESYHIYANLKNLKSGPENVENRLYSLIFSSFLEKYGAVPKDFPRSIDELNIQLLAKFITGESSPKKFQKLLAELEVEKYKSNPIVKDFKDKKYSLIIFEIDELGIAEMPITYSKEEKLDIQITIDANKSNIHMDQHNLSKLIRLYYFWEKLAKLMGIEYFEVIAAGKGTSCLLGKSLLLDNTSPSGISQIILEPLTKEDITAILREVLLKSNMIDQSNLEKLTKEIYIFTAGHPLYVGFSIYYYFLYVLNPEEYLEFNLKKALKEDKEVIRHIDQLIVNVKMYKNVWGLYQFFIDVVERKEMHKEMNWKVTESGPYIKTVELLDNLGISYSNGKASIITPILPGIFEEEFKAAVRYNFKIEAIESGIREEIFFANAFLNFSRNINLNPANNRNVDIKKMFPFLKRFPDFLQTEAFDDEYYLLPKITIKTNVIHKECDLKILNSLNPLDYPKLLQRLKDNVLYRHRELSSSCDFIFVQKIDKENKLFLLFQIKNSETNVDLKGEYRKVFKKTKLEEKNDIGCLYRLIIFNSAVTTEITFKKDEVYKAYFYDETKTLNQLSGDYKEMNKRILMYYVNPDEVQKFKQLEGLF